MTRAEFRVESSATGALSAGRLRVLGEDKVRFAVVFFSSRRRHTRLQGDWSSGVGSSDLTDVSGELLCRETRHRRIRQSLGLHTELPSRFCEEVSCEQGNIFATFAQRRKPQPDYVQPVDRKSVV